MKLLEEKTHLDPIYISFHADQHNRMNSVLQYSSFREEKNQNERSTRSPLLLHSINDIFFFPLHCVLLWRQESYFKLHSTSWRSERASGEMKKLPTQIHTLKPQTCLFSAAYAQLNEFSLATAFHRSDIITYTLGKGPSLDVASWLMGLKLRPGK